MPTTSAFSLQAPNRWWPWVLFALVLSLAPLCWPSSLGVAVLSQAGYLIIICLSYNILLGQGGMLSFGHAVYSGLGAFVAIHAMNWASQGGPLPLVLIPLVGAVGAAVGAALLGAVTIQKSGATFAMISLGVGELVAALALMLPTWFGGESGVSSNRVYGTAPWGITFGPALEVYYLIAIYCWVASVAMFAFTQTPLGRMLNAVRDNPERVEFMGYDTQHVRYCAFVIAGFFAGMGGGLAAISAEMVTAADSFSMARSGGYLLFTFLGGVAWFFGPIVGAVLLVLSSVLLSQWTQAWLLYLGLAFLLTVMYAPTGIAGILVSHYQRAWCAGGWRTLWPWYVALALAATPTLAALACAVEMAYHYQLHAALGPELRFMGLRLDSSSGTTWVATLVLASGGWWCCAWCQRRFLQQWCSIEALERQHTP